MQMIQKYTHMDRNRHVKHPCGGGDDIGGG